jgi:hypothetical protein
MSLAKTKGNGKEKCYFHERNVVIRRCKYIPRAVTLTSDSLNATRT